MQIYKYLLITCFLIVFTGNGQVLDLPVIPVPKEMEIRNELFCVSENFSFYWEEPQLAKLYGILQEEFFTLAGKRISKSQRQENSTFILKIDNSMKQEEYTINIEDGIKISGGSYEAVAMASTTVLQSSNLDKNSICWNRGRIHDFPDFNFRGILLDVARKKHDISAIKNMIMVCRWYKVNYLQLHLTDNDAFTFPSKTYPELSTQDWAYSREELMDLVAFANDRGVKLIPELEVPGHAGQLLDKMRKYFGFSDEKMNRSTVNMGNKNLYPVMDILFKEIAEIFHTSEFIHIGGDEADFRGMENDPEIQTFLQENNLTNIDELYWYFINRMNVSVKNAGKKTIVWEGFSKEGNKVVDKDIIVVAWETMYQLPQDILEAGFKTINASWKPLYVVNQRKWTPEEIYSWNIYKWESFHPAAPSFKNIQLAEHPGIIGAMMAFWEQPEYVELSSSRKRIPAMVEETWNHSKKSSYQQFALHLNETNKKLGSLLTPVKIKVEGLTYPKIEDGRKDEETWFQDGIRITLAEDRNLDIRYSLDSSKVTKLSTKYVKPIKINESTGLKYRAFNGDHPVGMEMLKYYELQPLKVALVGTFPIPIDSLWKTLRPETIKFSDKVMISISTKRKGTIRYILGEGVLNSNSKIYTSPVKIENTEFVKVGLFINDVLVGKPWSQKFEMD